MHRSYVWLLLLTISHLLTAPHNNMKRFKYFRRSTAFISLLPTRCCRERRREKMLQRIKERMVNNTRPRIFCPEHILCISKIDFMQSVQKTLYACSWKFFFLEISFQKSYSKIHFYFRYFKNFVLKILFPEILFGKFWRTCF